MFVHYNLNSATPQYYCMSMKLFIILLCFSLAFSVKRASAQSAKGKMHDKPHVQRNKPLTFTSTLGDVPGGQELSASFVKSLLDSALVVHDNHRRSYPVVSFSFGYQTNASYTNDTTGMPEKTSSYIAYPFNSNRLDSLWRTRIGNELKPGDQLFFDHILAKDSTGIFFLSSPLHFIIK